MRRKPYRIEAYTTNGVTHVDYSENRTYEEALAYAQYLFSFPVVLNVSILDHPDDSLLLFRISKGSYICESIETEQKEKP